MMMLGPIGFGAPLVLAALAVLPLLWWLLRALPPVPTRIRFPGTALLAGLRDPEPIARRTPWWLLLLRMIAVAAVILAFAQPVWRPPPPQQEGDALLIVMDAGATAAPGWNAARNRAVRAAETAIAAGRPVSVLLADGQGDAPLIFAADGSVAATLRAAQPQPWPGRYPVADAEMFADLPDGVLRTIWFSDGLDHPNRAAWLAALTGAGPVEVIPQAIPATSLSMIGDGPQPVLELATTGEQAPDILALGPDPQGIPRELARLSPGPPRREGGVTIRPVQVDLPPELLGRVTRFAVDGVESAAALVLGDDRLRRPVVALISEGRATSEGQALLSPAHYLRSALAGSARLIETGLTDALSAGPDVIVMMDRVGLEPDGPLADWVAEGGLLIRFAGPRMAAAPDLVMEPLLPVRLRPGGRDMGGALSWGAPRPIAPFDADGPFGGLTIPEDVTVRAQLMAEPSPDLAERSIAALSDGTPLVTRAGMGEGRLVLFHSTANADWSTLPLSGLFVEMLDRLVSSAGTRAAAAEADPAQAQDGIWTATEILDGFGRLRDASDPAPVPQAALAEGPGPDVPAGLYASGERLVALNAGGPITEASWPGATVETSSTPGLPLAGWLLLAATLALVADLAGAMVLRRGGAGGVTAALLLVLFMPDLSRAQEIDPDLMRAANAFAMGYVLTGDAGLDETSRQGLSGLSHTLTARTTVEPTSPVAVDLETADLTLLTFLYWPIGSDQPVPSAQAYLRLNRYLRGGGMILFDTGDADLAGTGPDNSADLRRLAGPLDMPPLQPVPDDHVLTRSFYLLDDLPGRYAGGEVWVEASSARDGTVNDGVSPVVIGGNGWAEAWAVDDRGLPVFAVGTGMDGERQREIAHRFGVNLIMYVLTGNYKSDQIHVPALLERLRQEEGG
ncbi:N-terminal double-transmembrane domain-containing protein [Paracoccus isoporae]|uniref:N-terminal double-transmembrane domain-containing protein n=1 Tax=Paracoccus isoporae TaxID=591205 RepID=A0A1G6XKV0_9RHOB|nr:DUF4159 domain-containing protein [Paracoccus isoporae]SDD78839.1 N-terminal double-transmembrane domain-containing protein [Paracoccus isoporae]